MNPTGAQILLQKYVKQARQPIWLSKYINEFTLGILSYTFVSFAYHQVEDQSGVDSNGFKQQLGFTVHGFISQTVQLLVAAPVSRQQL